MFELGRNQAIAEHEASDEIERVYHEIKQILRATGVNLNFRSWAAYGDFLPLMWDAFRPNAETRAFEDAADELRRSAAQAAETLDRLDALSQASLGGSQAFQVRAALDLYHYVNPKLLVLTSAVELSLSGEQFGRETSLAHDLIAPGTPSKMYAMEMESEEPDDVELQKIYADIKETLSLPSVNSDYRTLALWPTYLSAAWRALKPVVQSSEYQQLSSQLRETSRTLARKLPYHVSLDPQQVKGIGTDVEEVIKVTQSFESLLPGLIINIAQLQRDWRQGSELAASPFPAASRRYNSRGALQ